MPDTKSGREKTGKNKRAQLRERLYDRELETLDGDEELPELANDESEFLADAPPEERDGR
ncbi:hypothetical protein ACFQJD_18325 [Haloplanus sp. GCM10025708]|uniref:hypothetical protein n=1 Tax=Haloferacaceae TaxID=1644056 RepID=UPI003621D2C2